MIIVSSLSDHKNICESINASHLISVIDPGFQPATPKVVKKHLKLSFDDIIEIKEDNKIFRGSGLASKQILPNINHINQIVDFVLTWDQLSPIVIHCWCGVSRSMAVAAFILCKINSNNVETNVRYMRSIAPHANPNKLMITMFEKYLGIDGKINEAFKLYPYTVTYDCEITFAPVTIFKINELKEFK